MRNVFETCFHALDRQRQSLTERRTRKETERHRKKHNNVHTNRQIESGKYHNYAVFEYISYIGKRTYGNKPLILIFQYKPTPTINKSASDVNHVAT